MDGELQELFNYALSKGVTLFDTADSYVESHIHKHFTTMMIPSSLLYSPEVTCSAFPTVFLVALLM